MSVGRADDLKRFTRWLGAAAITLALAGTLAACSLGGATTSVNDQQALNALPWCVQPQISFVDSGSSSQQTITDWDQVKGELGFTPYLPATLPKGSCLDLVGGAIHDPIFGAHLSITWVLPGGNPISFSEAPKRGGAADKPQCEVSGQPVATGQANATVQPSQVTTVCIGALGNTSVTVASHMSQSELTTYFQKPSGLIELGARRCRHAHVDRSLIRDHDAGAVTGGSRAPSPGGARDPHARRDQ